MIKMIKPSLIFSLFWVIVLGIAVVTAAQWPGDTRLFPWAVGIPGLILALWQAGLDLWDSSNKKEATQETVIDIQLDRSIPEKLRIRGTLIAFGWILAFTFGIWILGFLISAPFFIFIYLKYKGRARLPGALVTAGCTTLFIWWVFDRIMHIPWPEAIILRLLGF